MSLLRVVIPFLGVVGLVLPGQAGRAAGQEARIEGTVVVGQVPVEDADVSIAALGRRVRVDEAGRFLFEQVPDGVYVVEAESPRWGRGVETVRVAGGSPVQITIRLEAVFHLDEMVVSAGAGATRRSEAYQPASVLTVRDLVGQAEATLGETLAREPGVSSTYFGPGSSRPLIRGIGGDRVRILEGGLGIGDASGTSPDHAVGTESRTADRIEVIRGPATLLYGSSAVGGIVNVLDGTIAREPPTGTLSGFVEGLAGTVADERTGSGMITARAGPVVLSASGLWRDAEDYAIPGFGEADHDEADHEAGEHGDEVEGVLENSALGTRRGKAGVTLLGNRGYLGVAVSGQRTEYGVPGGAHGHGEEEPGEEEHSEEGVSIDLEQDRLDLDGALRFPTGTVRNVRARLGLTDYRHVELEGDEVGTRFSSESFEGRVESEHGWGEGVHGAVGVQFASRDFEAVGDEAFVPPSTTRSTAVFGYEELRVSEALRLQAGLRFEHQRAEQRETGNDITHTGVSASAGASWDASERLSFALSTSRSVKLPNAEELFSNGPHAATRAYEIGDPDLTPERALGVDLTTHVHGERFRGSASIFATGFADYIHEAATGELEDGLPVYRYTQADARFTGFELEAELDVLEGDPTAHRPHVSVEAMADYVAAKLTDTDESLPRIPPFRVGGGVNYRQGPFVIRASVRRTADQDDVGPRETPTPGFTMVDASASYRFFTGGLFHDLTLVGTNLTDTEARLHTSFLKDVAPLPGREIRLVYRVNF